MVSLKKILKSKLLILSLIIFLFPSSASLATPLHEGLVALKKGQWNQAIQIFSRINSSLPSFVHFWLLGHAFYAKGRYAKASAYYQKALQSAPKKEFPRLYNNIGNTFFRRKKLGAAMQFYIKALKIDPSYERARYNLELTLRSLSPPPPPPPPSKSKQQPPQRRKMKRTHAKRTKLKHQAIAPPRESKLSMPDPRKIQLNLFDKFVPYSRVLKKYRQYQRHSR